jgi:predicted AlkP superfamily phosphohydrolase/phosphomutase
MLRRTLASAALCAVLFAADLVLLTLFLNAELSLRQELAALSIALFMPYALGWTLLLLGLGGLGLLFRFWPRSLRPPLEGLPWFTSFALTTVLALLALYALNLEAYRTSVPQAAERALAAVAWCLSGCALLLVAVGVDALLRPHRTRGVSAALVVLATAASLIVPLAARPKPAAPQPPASLPSEPLRPLRRVVLVGLDGLSPEFVRDAAARGRLPALARLMRRGASAPLANFEPSEAPPLWTSVVTGRLPRDHGVKSFSTYRLRGSKAVYELLPKGAFVSVLERAGLVFRAPVTAAARRRRALWSAANAFGIHAGVVRLWATHPAEPIQGFMLSNYFHIVRASQAPAAALHPPELLEQVLARAVSPREVERTLISRFVDLSVDTADAFDWRTELVDRALAPDLTYQRAADVLRGAYDPPFFAITFHGLDVVGHAFMRYARPRDFGNVGDAEIRRYGAVIERYAAFVSEWIGELERGLRADEVLFVVSCYGMRPLPHWRSVLHAVLGAATPSGSHAGAPHGFLIAAGSGIKPGAVVESASILDVAPTVLYLMGLPIGRDMEGRVLGELLDEESARRQPVTFIPSYESLARRPPPLAGEPPDLDLPPIPDPH